MESTIMKIKKERNFVALSNDVVTDRRLSFAARGILTYLLSKPVDWEVRTSDLVNQSPAGRDFIYQRLKELEQFGYFRRIKYRTPNGTWQWVTEVYEVPRESPQEQPLPNQADKECLTNIHNNKVPPSTAFPYTDDPDTHNPDKGKPEILITKTKQNKELTNREGIESPSNSQVEKRRKAANQSGSDNKEMARTASRNKDNQDNKNAQEADTNEYKSLQIDINHITLLREEKPNDKKATKRIELATQVGMAAEPQPPESRAATPPSQQPASTEKFCVNKIWQKVIEMMGYNPQWRWSYEAKVVNRLREIVPEATVEDFVAFIAHQHSIAYPDKSYWYSFAEREKRFVIWYQEHQKPKHLKAQAHKERKKNYVYISD